MKKALEDSWGAIDTAIRKNAYGDTNPWAFVALVALFIVAYLVIGYLELPQRIESLVAALAAYVLGAKQGRTFRPNGK